MKARVTGLSIRCPFCGYRPAGIAPVRGIPLLRQHIACEACGKCYGVLAGIPDKALRRLPTWSRPRCAICGTKLRRFCFGGSVQFYRCDSCWRTVIVQE